MEWISGPSFLPSFSFYEIHESGALNAKPAAVIAAIAALDMRADRVADVLLSMRELPSRIGKLFGRRPHAVPFGFDTFTLLRRNSHELSLGLAGRFWRPDLGLSAISSAREFQCIDHPGVAKLVLRFQVVEHQKDACILRTETFVYCPGRRTKMLFAPYWLIIRLASGWIRRRTLASIQKTFSMSG